MQLTELTGIPYEIILALKDSQAQSLFTLISFTEELEVFDNDIVLEEYKSFDFNSVPYAEAEVCRKASEQEITGFELAIILINTLVKHDITNEPFLKVIGTANFFLSNSLISIITIPNLANIRTALNKSKQELIDYKTLVALERTLNSQGLKPLETQ
mgnify:FL=1